MTNYKAAIFDLDGVIVDTAKFHFLAWRKLANDLGFDFSLAQNEQLKGVSRERSLEKILQWGGRELSPEEFRFQMDLKNKNYLSYVAEMDAGEILPGVLPVLDFLKERHIPVALGSASKNARTILERTGLLGRFSGIVDGTDVTLAKPDPEVFLIAAEKLKVPPQQAVVFEDSVAGVQAAIRAGMLSIGIGEKEILGQADHVFIDFKQISYDFLKKIFS